jgi:hypothetical protein
MRVDTIGGCDVIALTGYVWLYAQRQTRARKEMLLVYSHFGVHGCNMQRGLALAHQIHMFKTARTNPSRVDSEKTCLELQCATRDRVVIHAEHHQIDARTQQHKKQQTHVFGLVALARRQLPYKAFISFRCTNKARRGVPSNPTRRKFGRKLGESAERQRKQARLRSRYGKYT